ncbi:MAG: DUF3256 family protein [Prevotella sp.]|nr:DUF3256 family protein [Prevotella sp.]
MKKTTTAAMLLIASLQMPAQTTMRDLWLALPDSVVPYLNASQRTEHADFIDMGVASEVKNLLDGEGRMDTLTARYASVRLNDNHTLQMRLLTKSDSTQVVCLVDTYRAPEPESTISFFDTRWQRLGDTFGLPDLHTLVSDAGQMERFFAKPDTLSQTATDELKKMIDPVMVSISLPEDEESVILQLSTPFLLQDEKERLKSVLMQTKFKWMGDLFKECE